MANFLEIFEDATKKGKKIPTDKYLKDGKYPIIDQGHTYISGYYNDENGLFVDIPAIIFGDHTRIIKYVDQPCFLGADGVKLLKAKDKQANYKYLFYALLNAKIPNTGYNRHFKWLKELEIPLPPINVQYRIVSTLDKVTHTIDLCKAILEKLDMLVKARFVEMFGDFKTNSKGWIVAKFTDIATIDGNMTTDFTKYADYPHIGIDSIEKNTGHLKGYRTVAEDNVISGKYLFTPKHIIYSKIRPNLNKVALPEFNGVCSADAYPILPNEKNCNRIFLAFVIRSDYFLDYILQFCNRTNLPKVNRKEVSGFTTPLPPLTLQNQFSDFVEQIDKTKAAVQKTLDKAQLLFDSLMQEYFG